MKADILRLQLNKANADYNILQEQYLKQLKKSILEMDKSDQAEAWKWFNAVSKFIELQMDLIDLLVGEVNFANARSDKSLRDQLAIAKNYIRTLGYNPSILTYMKLDDFNK